MKNTHRFTIQVNCNLSGEKEFFEDNGFIILPQAYRESGKPTRLVISCHGAGGTVTTDDSQVEHQALTLYLVANGYAVMDVNGLPAGYAEKNGIDIRNNIGSPIAIRSYVGAYRYCIERFNLYPEVFVHGASMGGISSTNLVLSEKIPVIAHSAFCPVLDTYNEIFLHPWSEGLPKIALAKIYGLETDSNGEYIYDEGKITPYNPVKNEKSEKYPVPVKFWHCMDDEVVSYKITEKFISAIARNGGNAHLEAFEHGGHEPQLAGDIIYNPSGECELCGERIEIRPAVEETLLWIKSFE